MIYTNNTNTDIYIYRGLQSYFTVKSWLGLQPVRVPDILEVSNHDQAWGPFCAFWHVTTAFMQLHGRWLLNSALKVTGQFAVSLEDIKESKPVEQSPSNIFKYIKTAADQLRSFDNSAPNALVTPSLAWLWDHVEFVVYSVSWNSTIWVEFQRCWAVVGSNHWHWNGYRLQASRPPSWSNTKRDPFWGYMTTPSLEPNSKCFLLQAPSRSAREHNRISNDIDGHFLKSFGSMTNFDQPSPSHRQMSLPENTAR